MSHNYQFLHSVVRGVYQDLPVAKADAVPAEVMAEVRKYASVFDAQNVGLSASYCYFMIPDSKGTPNLFFSKTARKENSTSLCYYAQCAGWKFNNVYSLPDGALLPSDDFDSIFRFAFYTENEVDACAEKNPPCAFGSGSAPAPEMEPFAIAPKAIQAILHGAISRWYISSDPVYVEVPEGVDYNAYVMNAVKKLYSYFPVAVKANVGFVSYLAPENASKYPHISIVFVPSSMSSSKTIRLDGSSTVACDSMIGQCSFGKTMNAFLEHLAYLSDENERRSFLEAVLIDAEFSAAENRVGSIQPMAYSVMGGGLRLLKLQGSAEEQFPEWMEFAEKQEEYPKGIAGQVWEHIDAMLTAEELVQILQRGRAVKIPTGEAELNKTLGSLKKVCHGREALYGVLWSYAVAVLENRILSDAETFDWLTKCRNSLLKFTDEDTYERFRAGYGARCAEAIRANAEAVIRNARIDNRSSYRAMAATTATDAVKSAEKYGNFSGWESELKAAAEECIAADVENALKITEKAIRDADVSDRKKFRAMAEAAIAKAVQDAGDSKDFSGSTAALKALAEERIGADVEKALLDAEQKIRNAKIENRAEYRRKAEATIANAVRDAGNTADISPRMMELRTIAEDRIAETVENALAQQKRGDMATTDAYRAAMDACGALLAELPAAGVYPQSDRVRSDIEQYLAELENAYNTLMNSVGTLIESFENKYFIAIDKYEAKKQNLTDSQQQEVNHVLDRLRPKDFHDYKKKYEQQTRKPFNAAILIHDHSGAGNAVGTDLRKLLGKPIEMSLDRKSAETIVEELDYYISLGRFFVVPGEVTVKVTLPGDPNGFDGGSQDVVMKAAELRSIVMLSLEQGGTREAAETVCAVVNMLRENGAIRQGHEYAVLEMFCRCEYDQAAGKLLADTNNLEGTAIRSMFQSQFKAEAKKKKSGKSDDKSKNILLGVLGGTAAVAAVAAVILSVKLGSMAKDLKSAEKAVGDYIGLYAECLEAKTAAEADAERYEALYEQAAGYEQMAEYYEGLYAQFKGMFTQKNAGSAAVASIPGKPVADSSAPEAEELIPQLP